MKYPDYLRITTDLKELLDKDAPKDKIFEFVNWNLKQLLELDPKDSGYLVEQAKADLAAIEEKLKELALKITLFS